MRAIGANLEDVIAAAFRPVAAAGIRVRTMLAVAATFDVSKGDFPAIERDIGRQERSAFGLVAAQTAHTVVPKIPRTVRPAADLLALQPAALDDRADQQVAGAGVWTERIVQRAQRAAGPSGDAVVLVAHMVVDSQVAFYEQQLVEIQQRIAERDFAPQSAGIGEQHVACFDVFAWHSKAGLV